MKTLVHKYSSVFQSGIGKLKHFKAQFSLNKQPCYMKHRNVSYALREKVDKERIQKADILERIKCSEWASPIVPVVKKNGSVRICGDFKTTLNPTLKDENYPLPRIADIFATLARGQRFSKVDLTQAYLRMEVHPDHRKYLTINTQQGLFQYKCLPYVVTDAPAKWQRVIDTIQVMQDDLMIAQSNDSEYFKNLDAVLQRLKP